jgi:DNA polymerase IV
MILHVDMDAFYASVEQRDDPKLLGKPVVVGGSPDGRGVVSAASYEARKYGVHSAMPARRAKQLCNHLVFVRPRIDYYAQISKQIRNVFEDYTPIVEPLSLDEAFLDVTGTERLHGTAPKIAVEIKLRIREELGLIASIGVAPNKFLAKIASDLQKPDSLVVVDQDHIQSFLDPLPVGRIWGVGKVSAEALRQRAITTIGQLRQLPLVTLTQMFGSCGEQYWSLSRGIDPRRVVPDREAKSISNETTFEEDISDLQLLKAWLVVLAESVGRRIRAHDLKAKSIELKIRFSDFKTVTRSMTLEFPTDITAELVRCAHTLFEERIQLNRQSVRLIGVGVSNFANSTMTQLSLFDEPEREQQRSLDSATDEIAKRFGKAAIYRAAKLDTATIKKIP